MPERLYRCYNPDCSDPAGPLGHDFAGEAPGECPKCGLRGDDPRFKHLIVARVVIHFDPPGKVRGYGAGYAACTGKLIQGEGTPRYTRHPAAVTCTACLQTDVCKKGLAELAAPSAEYDVPDCGCGAAEKGEKPAKPGPPPAAPA